MLGWWVDKGRNSSVRRLSGSLTYVLLSIIYLCWVPNLHYSIYYPLTRGLRQRRPSAIPVCQSSLKSANRNRDGMVLAQWVHLLEYTKTCQGDHSDKATSCPKGSLQPGTRNVISSRMTLARRHGGHIRKDPCAVALDRCHRTWKPMVQRSPDSWTGALSWNYSLCIILEVNTTSLAGHTVLRYVAHSNCCTTTVLLGFLRIANLM